MRNRDEFHTLFGKLYVWIEDSSGNLVLHSVAQMERTLAQVAAIIGDSESSNA